MSLPTPASPRRRAVRRFTSTGVAASLLLAVSAGHAVQAQAADTVLPAATRYAPTAVPDRLTLIPTADPAHSQKVNWRSTAETPRAQIIEAPAAFGDVHTKATGPINGTDYADIRTVEGTTETVGAGSAGYTNRYHSVEFKDLKPNTRYSYRVGDGTNPTPSTSGSGAGSISNWTAWEDFTTAADGSVPFSFIYFGDAQNYIDSAVPRVFHQALLDRPDAKVLLHAGDLINQTGTSDANLAVQEKEWAEWFDAAGFANATRNVIATPGNHEYNSSTAISAFWKPQFPMPENGPKGDGDAPLEAVRRSTYYTDYQGVRFISLDSSPLQNGPVQESVLAAQTSWLEDVLKDANRPKWTVVTFHHPVYAGTSTRNNSVVRDNWNPLFDKYGVDLVLQGHDHVYNRGNQVKDNDPNDPTKSHGTVYSISVSGGKMYELNQGQNWTDNAANRRVAGGNIQLYQLIDVDGDELTYQARLSNGEFFDGYRVTKAGKAADERTVQDLDSDPESGEQVAPAVETTTELATSAAEVKPGEQVTLRATVSGDGAKGHVRFYDAAQPLGDPVELRDGHAELRTSELREGHHALSAVFVPEDDAAFVSSSSRAVLVGVVKPAEPLPQPAPVTVTTPTPAPVPAVPAPAAPGKAKVTAHVAGTVARNSRASVVIAVAADDRFVPGTVTVTDRKTKKTWKSRAKLRGGLVTVTSPRLKRGTYRLRIAYHGSAVATKGSATKTVRVR